MKNSDTKSMWKYVHKKLDSISKKQGIEDIIVNLIEVLQTSLNLKQKFGGNDGIHAYVLKLAAPYIVSILAHIINNIIG